MTEAAPRSANSPVVKIGVLLPQPPDELGEWLADAAAFEAAGADALWIDAGATLDPLTLTAALAALTYRSLLVTALPEGVPEPHVLATVRRLGGGRLALYSEGDPWTDPASQEPDLRVFRPAGSPAEPGVVGTHFPSARVSAQDGESWVEVPPPTGRTAWRETLADAAERGDRGLLIPADSRLLDILRNPGDPDGRQDLHLAQG